MSEAGATAAHDAHAEHHELGFISHLYFLDRPQDDRPPVHIRQHPHAHRRWSLSHDDALGTRLAGDPGAFYQLDIRALYVSCGRGQYGWRS